LEEITAEPRSKAFLPDSLVTISDVRWIGTVALEVTFKDAAGGLGNQLLYPDREPTLEIVDVAQPWNFDADPDAVPTSVGGQSHPAGRDRLCASISVGYDV